MMTSGIKRHVVSSKCGGIDITLPDQVVVVLVSSINRLISFGVSLNHTKWWYYHSLH